VNEAAGTATLTVTKTGGTTQSHSVTYASASGTATAGADFTSVGPTQLTFASGVTTQSVVVNLLDDALYEGSSENFTVGLSSATGGATIGTASGTVTLTENDAAPTFTINNVSVNEGGTATLTVTKNNATALAHHVSYQSSNGNAIAGSDYTAIPLTQFTFAPGDVSKTIIVSAISDGAFETGEFYNVVLSGADNGASISSGTGVVTINETNNAPSFSISPVTLAENGGSMGFTITKSGSTTLDHSVSYSTSNGSATAGQDYTAVSSSHTFTAGESSSGFSVILATDGTYEGNETFTITLSSPTNGAVIATPTVTNTITDSNNPPEFAITGASFSEGAGTVSVTITKTGSTALTHDVSYSNNGGTAIAGTDYTPFSGTLSFGPSETSKTFPMAITDDAAVEGNESVIVQLSSPTNGAYFVSPGTTTLTILDNEAANTININDVMIQGTTGGYTTQGVYHLTSGGDVVVDAPPGCSPNCGDVGDWIAPKSSISNYQARAINNGCSYTGGVSMLFGTWYNLSGSPQWGESISTPEPTTGSDSCTLTIQISAVANPTAILDSATISFNLWTGE
jgi:hypothetical protein